MANLNDIKYVVINNQTYEIDGAVHESLNEIKEAAIEIDPSLDNAEVVVTGDTVTFIRKAGTKGENITKVVYAGEEFEPSVTDADPKDIRKAMSEIYPELENADYIINDGIMTFRLKAGTKGF